MLSSIPVSSGTWTALATFAGNRPIWIVWFMKRIDRLYSCRRIVLKLRDSSSWVGLLRKPSNCQRTGKICCKLELAFDRDGPVDLN